MEEVLPAFQEASRCAVCNCAFSTFKRRHHCRSCGKSLCNEHSSNQMCLPQFGIKTPVRVCDDCFKISQQINNGTKISVKVGDSTTETTNSMTKLDISSDEDIQSEDEKPSTLVEAPSHNCTCGMPLCICVIPPTEEVVSVPQPVMAVMPTSTPSVPSSSKPAPKKVSTNSSYGNQMPSLFFSSSKTANGGNPTINKNYEATGEGIREALKNGDTKAVKDLLGKGVDPNHQDKQGMSLLHLAAVFNYTEIAMLLIDAGAKADCKNAQGETPIDCAQATLQYKMRQKINNK